MVDKFDIRSIEDLPQTRYCRDHQTHSLTSRFLQVVSGIGVSNVFNPSFLERSDVSVFAFRAIPDGSNDLVSFVSIDNGSGRKLSRIAPDLYGELDAPRLVDPKVFTVGEAVYLTFNSGWVPSGGNDIFVMQVYPNMGTPKRMIYQARRDQERNWAFFSERGEVYAVYQIAPLVILRLEAASAGSWRMVDHFRGDASNVPHDLTLGTQPSRHGGQYYFMAHRKYEIKRKKVYMGRLCVLDPGKMTVTSGNRWFVHSPESLLGDAVKHNANLFSCTYFSGLQASDTGITLGYGVNDVDFGFSTHSFSELLK